MTTRKTEKSTDQEAEQDESIDGTEDEQPEGEDSEDTEGGDDAEDGDEESADDEQDEDSEDDEDRQDLPPEVMRDQLSKARAQAANYRTQLRAAQKALEEAETPEELQEAVTKLREDNLRLEREILVSNVARKHGLPDELAELLKGDDEKSLNEHALKLKKFVPEDEDPDPDGLRGGLGPDSDDDFDPVAISRQNRIRR